MHIISLSNRHLPDRAARIMRAIARVRQAPAITADIDAILFSIKSFAAAMLAYYISLRIGLPRPYWAIVTVYVVSQTSAGASFGRGLYRLAGTIIGAVATVAIVPNFVTDPIICSVILACWIGLCLFFSLLDRMPRAYAFLLAGYTASLIGFPSVLEPEAIFDIASVRVQEIGIGIVCAILWHRFLLPKRMTGQFNGKLAATLRDARRMAGDALAAVPQAMNRRDRARMAADLLALQGLATHLPYDPAPITPHNHALQLIHDRLARLLVLATEIEDRIRHLRTGNHVYPALDRLIEEARLWMTASGPARQAWHATHMADRARSLQALGLMTDATPADRLAANLAGHLAEMIGLMHDCDRIEQDMALADRKTVMGALHGKPKATGYIYHRDPWMAARAAMGAIIGITIACMVWIWSAWPDGALAVSILGVCCALFGTVDTPAPHLIKYMTGALYGVAISLIYSFVILPRVTDFSVLVMALAPAFLFAGSLQARLPTTFMALGITLTLPILAGLGSAYAGDFAESLNSSIALFAAVGFAVVSMSLFQTIPADSAIERLLRLSRRDIARRARGRAANEARWTSLMIDRTALLLPRLRLAHSAGPDVLEEVLHILRVGHAVGRLRAMVRDLDAPITEDTRTLLKAIAARFSSRRTPRNPVDLTDRLTEAVAASALPQRVQILDLLIDLRFALTSMPLAYEEPCS